MAKAPTSPSHAARTASGQSIEARELRRCVRRPCGPHWLGAEKERLQFTWAAHETCGAFDVVFHQARSGPIPDEVWDRWAVATRRWLSFPGIRPWWAAKPSLFAASFSAFVAHHDGDHPAGSASTERWLQSVRGAPD